jgi:hypothetical protein
MVLLIADYKSVGVSLGVKWPEVQNPVSPTLQPGQGTSQNEPKQPRDIQEFRRLPQCQSVEHGTTICDDVGSAAVMPSRAGISSHGQIGHC